MKNKSLKRRNYLIDELLRLDEKTYIEKPLYQMPLSELEMIHISEKNKQKHIENYVRRNCDEFIKAI